MINTDPNHKHTFDAQGNMTCCSLEEKIYAKSEHSDSDNKGHTQSEESESVWREYLPAIISFILIITGIVFDNFIKPDFFQGYVRLLWYIVAYIPVGIPVIKDAVISISKGAFFSEFFLMSIATLGAFFIGEYSEGVAVMLFYAVGELFQTAAVNRAKRSIKALLDIRPNTVSVLRNGTIQVVSPSEIQIGETIQAKPGEKVAL